MDLAIDGQGFLMQRIPSTLLPSMIFPSGGGGVELGNLVFLNGLPVAGWGRVNWGGFEDSGGDTVEKGSVHNVTNGIGKIGEYVDTRCGTHV